jgi:phenylalanine-4-hydroxylase
MYEAIRLLSIVKEAEDTPQATIEEAEQAVEDLQNNMGELSEMAQIRNLHWWTGIWFDRNSCKPKIILHR